MATVLQRWARVQQRRPMITTIVTGCTVMFCGDLAAQTYEGKHKTGYDLPRLAIGTTWQGAIAAPLFGSWFRLLDQTVKAVGLRGAVAKTVANQLVSPLPVNAGYMVFSTSCEALAHNRFHEQQVWADIKHRLTHNLIPVILNSALFWIPVNTLNFALVPPAYRVLPSIFGGVVWGWYISFTQHKPH